MYNESIFRKDILKPLQTLILYHSKGDSSNKIRIFQKTYNKDRVDPVLNDEQGHIPWYNRC